MVIETPHGGAGVRGGRPKDAALGGLAESVGGLQYILEEALTGSSRAPVVNDERVEELDPRVVEEAATLSATQVFCASAFTSSMEKKRA